MATASSWAEYSEFMLFGLVSVVLAAANAGSSHTLRSAQVFFVDAVHFVRLPRKRAA
jgi:hypothetical protein